MKNRAMPGEAAKHVPAFSVDEAGYFLSHATHPGDQPWLHLDMPLVFSSSLPWADTRDRVVSVVPTSFPYVYMYVYVHVVRPHHPL